MIADSPLSPAARRAALEQLYAAMHEAVGTSSLRLVSVTGASVSAVRSLLDETVDLLRGGSKSLTVVRADLLQNDPVTAAIRLRFGVEAGRSARTTLDTIGLGLTGLVTPARLDDAVRLLGGLVGATEDERGRPLPGLEPSIVGSERFRSRALKTALNLLRYDTSRSPHLWIITGAPATGAGLGALGLLLQELRERPVACVIVADPPIADSLPVPPPARAVTVALRTTVADAPSPFGPAVAAPGPRVAAPRRTGPVDDTVTAGAPTAASRPPGMPPAVSQASDRTPAASRAPVPTPAAPLRAAVPAGVVAPVLPTLPQAVADALAFSAPIGWPPLIAALAGEADALYDALETLRSRGAVEAAGLFLVGEVEAVRIDAAALSSSGPPAAMRASWHRAAADWLSAMRPIDADAWLEARAMHLERGERPEAAARLLLEAARQDTLSDRALARLERATRLIDGPYPALAADVGLSSCAAALEAGAIEQARAASRLATRALLAFPGLEAELAGLDALLARHDGRASEARSALAEGLVGLTPEGPERRARHAERLAMVLAGEPDTDALAKAADRLEDARRAARGHGGPRMVGRLAAALGAIESARGRLEPAIAALEEASELLEAAGAPTEAAFAWLELSKARRAHGFEASADDALTRAADHSLGLSAADETLVRPTIPEIRGVGAALLAESGSSAGAAASPWGGARAVLPDRDGGATAVTQLSTATQPTAVAHTSAVTLARSVGQSGPLAARPKSAHPVAVAVAAEQAMRLADAGRGVEARAVLDGVPSTVSVLSEAIRATAEARTALSRGEERLAREHAGRAVDLAKRSGDVGLLVDALRERARAAGHALFVSTDAGAGLQAAAVDLRQARDLLERTGRLRDLPDILEALGSVLLESGATAESRRVIERGTQLRRTMRPAGHADKAMREARTIRREYPTTPIAIDELGEVLDRLQAFQPTAKKKP